MSDSETIARLRDEFVAAFNREDIAALSNLLEDDSVGMPPNRVALQGLAGTQAFWREGFAVAKSRVEFTSARVEIAGDVAVDEQRWSMDSTPLNGGMPVHDEGKGIWLLRRQQDGNWKVARAIWNSDLPQAGLWSGAAATASSSALDADDRKTLRTLIEDEWTAGCVARDWDKVLAMCAEDIVYMPADQPALRGHAELRSWLDQFPPILTFTQPLEELEGDAGLAVARATFRGTIAVGQDEVPVSGKVLCSLRKAPTGAWLARRVCWNWDRPMTGAS
jgi:ketosteroid isomerase-like protein